VPTIGPNAGLAVICSTPQTPSCFWQLDKEPWAATPALAGVVKFDVAIIGAGYTGLAAAYHLKSADPALEVAVLEAETVGFGASGRNAGFVMTLFGSSVALMKLLHGKQRVREAHNYIVRAIAELEAIISEHAISCDYQRSGFLRVATTPAYVSRIRNDIELLQSLGIKDLDWVDAKWLRARIRAEDFLGACWEPISGSLNPMKWLQGLRRLAEATGARLFENTRVTAVDRVGGRYRLATPTGTAVADKIVYATNGYTHLMPGMRSKQMPAFAYIVVTEPLRPDQLAAIGWEGREVLEDGRNFMHFYRLTPDNRILAGGGPGFVPFGSRMDHDANPAAWEHLARFIGATFPQIGDIRIAHRWGGAFSVTSDMTPQIGLRDGGGAAYALGCTGHGVAMTHMNGRILRDLVLERRTELTDLWFVNRRSLPIPPEPVRSVVAGVATMSMKLDDWWCDRNRRDCGIVGLRGDAP
jgi:glycine/D-amino acid oxidase-like deaminating enzyme